MSCKEGFIHNFAYYEIQRKQKWFDGIDELVDWYNYTKPHMFLDWNNLETPAKAFVFKDATKRKYNY